MSKRNIYVTCHPRINEVLGKELGDLGFDVTSIASTGVHVLGSFLDTMKMNLYLRSANRVLFELSRVTARTADDLYKEVKKLPWEDYLHVNGYFSVQSSVRNDEIKDNRFANLRLKDAIVDRMVEKTGKRPNSGPDYSKAVLFLYWNETEAIIYYDTSGETISRRIYRKNPWKAPMNEALAAATVLSTRWDKKQPFVVPMCGSGTLAIEAALISMNKAPGLERENFSFMHCKMYDSRIWRMTRNEAMSKAKFSPQAEIILTDRDPGAITAARENAKKAGLARSLEFSVCNFEDTPIPKGPGVVFLNPEYGQRLGEEEQLLETYSSIGDFFKQKCKGYFGYIFTGNLELAKKIGLAASKRIPFYNGKIDCRLLEYELYEGSRRDVT